MEEAMKADDIKLGKGFNKQEVGIAVLKYLLEVTTAEESPAEDLD
jgi:hypothetical protein